MGNSVDKDVGQVDGFCDERFEDVERLFSKEWGAQLCVYVNGKIVVSNLNLKCDL